MTIKSYLLLLIITLSMFATQAQSNPLATVKIGDKKYNLHLVMSGETIYQLSKRYNVAVSDILYSNPWGSDTILMVGQVVKVPVKPLPVVYKSEIVPIVQPVVQEEKVVSPPAPAYTQPVTPVVQPAPVSTNPDYVVIEKGMTLYGISKQYNVSIAQIMGWNKMDSLKIKIGDTLLVKSPSLIKKSSEQVQEKKQDTPLIERPSSPATQEAIDEKTISAESTAALKEKFSDSNTANKILVTQRGSSGTLLTTNAAMKTVNYCLHRSAAIGSIIKVQSLVTNRTSYVKVLGKLQDTPENQPFMIRVSESVAKELGISTEKTFVEVSYYE